MIVLDAYAVIAFLLGERAAAEVGELLRSEESVALTALGVAEVVDRLVRGAGIEADEVMLDLAELGLADAPDVEATLMVRAGLLRARRYHRQRCSVSLADCLVVESAREWGAAVASSDPHLLDVCRLEGVAAIVLPDTAGNRWTSS